MRLTAFSRRVTQPERNQRGHADRMLRGSRSQGRQRCSDVHFEGSGGTTRAKMGGAAGGQGRPRAQLPTAPSVYSTSPHKFSRVLQHQCDAPVALGEAMNSDEPTRECTTWVRPYRSTSRDARIAIGYRNHGRQLTDLVRRALSLL